MLLSYYFKYLSSSLNYVYMYVAVEMCMCVPLSTSLDDIIKSSLPGVPGGVKDPSWIVGTKMGCSDGQTPCCIVL